MESPRSRGSGNISSDQSGKLGQHRARLRLVVADDDKDIRERLTEILHDEYDLVAIVQDGQQLVEAVKAFRPDVAVVDITMPVLSGLEALRQLREQGFATRVVFFTGNSSPAYVRRALQDGALGYVIKGSGIEDLPAALRAAMAGDTFISAGINYAS